MVLGEGEEDVFVRLPVEVDVAAGVDAEEGGGWEALVSDVLM